MSLMTMETCWRCGPSAKINQIVYSEGNKVCRACGLILKEDDHMVASVIFRREEGRIVALQKEVPDGPDECLTTKHINNLAGILGFPEHLRLQMLEKFRKLDRDLHWGRNTLLLAASIAYLVLRLHKKPYTILDVAERAQVDPFDLGRAYTNLVTQSKEYLEELDPTLYVDRLCCQLGLGNTELGKTIRKQAVRLIDIAKWESIVTGRRPYAVSGAVVHLAATANNLQDLKDIDYSVKHIAALLRIAPGTITARMKEMKELLFQKAQSLPWKITPKNVVSYIPTILSAVEAQNRLETRNTPVKVEDSDYSLCYQRASLPPSFKINQAARDKRRHKVELAKKRLQATISGDSIDEELMKGLDNEDLAIEKMLMQGVPEDRVVDGNSTDSGPVVIIDDGGELGEEDIPDSEIHNFIRTDKEVEVVGTDFDPPTTSKKQKASSDKRKEKRRRASETSMDIDDNGDDYEQSTPSHSKSSRSSKDRRATEGEPASDLTCADDADKENRKKRTRRSKKNQRESIAVDTGAQESSVDTGIVIDKPLPGERQKEAGGDELARQTGATQENCSDMTCNSSGGFDMSATMQRLRQRKLMKAAAGQSSV